MTWSDGPVLMSDVNGCLPLSALHERLQNDPDEAFWSHLRKCARCMNAAVTLDPEVVLGERDDFARQHTVIDPRLYADKVPFKRGGMYQTWLATDRRLGRRVVIKGMPEDDDGDVGKRHLLQACLRREGKILAQLTHPSIVTLLEAGEWSEGEAFYTTELVAGDTLSEAIGKRHTLQDRLSLLPAFTSLVDAVSYCHGRGIVHRDLSPHNIIVGNGSATLIDWTTAKYSDPATDREAILDAAELPDASQALTTLTLASWGTPGFAPPEQRGHAFDHDHRVDIFTLGATLQFLITGERPFPGQTVDEILHNVDKGTRSPPQNCPPPLKSIIDKAMATNPAARYPSAGALAEDLRRFQAEQLVLAHEYGSLERFAHSRWFKPALATMVALIVSLTAILLQSEFERVRTQAAVATADAQRRIQEVESLTATEKMAMQAALEEVSVEASAQVRKAFEDKAYAEGAKRTAEQERAVAFQAATVAYDELAFAARQREDALVHLKHAEEKRVVLERELEDTKLRMREAEAVIERGKGEIESLKEERKRLLQDIDLLQKQMRELGETVGALKAAVAALPPAPAHQK